MGNGGWAGTIPYAAIAAAMAAGYAGAGTDTGHTGSNADFALGHPEKLIDLAYRSIHEMTVQSKAIINAHYGSPAKFSYYNGCSQGGRQGLAAAQRYPEDFNGIIAGASAWNQMRMHGARTALNLIGEQGCRTASSRRAKYPMIHDAVLNACDALDGVKDGVIENPVMCKFDYAKLAVQSRRWRGLSDERPGRIGEGDDVAAEGSENRENSFDGHLMPGSELGWATLGGPEPLGTVDDRHAERRFPGSRLGLPHDEHLHRCRSGRASPTTARCTTGDPNLKPFFDRGGKLLMYHGWSDPQVTPLNSVIYYNERREDRRERQSGEFDRAVHGAGHESLPGRPRHRHL